MSLFMLREISAARCEHIVINTAASGGTCRLPVSKTGVAAHGCSRTWTCVCKTKPSLCAYCLGIIIAQLEFLDGLKLSRGWLFPAASGEQ
eukprot:5593143-Amphidinium_carterae.1